MTAAGESSRGRLPRSFSGLLAIAVLALLYLAWTQGLDPVFDALELLESQVRARPAASVALFIALFVVGTTASLPIGSLLCLAAGYLFGIVPGAATALAGGTGGALVTFVLVRQFAGKRIRRWLLQSRGARLLAILERDVFYYLVVLRIVPVAPFFVINAAAAATGVDPGRYLLATALGLIPTTVVYAAIGSGVEGLVEAREMAGPGLLLQPRILLPLLALVAMVIASAWLRRRLGRRREAGPRTP